MVSAHKMIHNIFSSGTCHKPHSIFKSKSQDLHKRNIGLFSVKDTRMAGYFMGMHRDLRMQKVLQATISSAEFLSITTTTKFNKAVKFVHDEKSWGRCYVLLKTIFPCLRVLRLADSNILGMDKVYYYSRMTKQCMEKKNLILIIRGFFLKYHQLSIYGSRLMTKVTKKSQQYQQ